MWNFRCRKNPNIKNKMGVAQPNRLYLMKDDIIPGERIELVWKFRTNDWCMLNVRLEIQQNSAKLKYCNANAKDAHKSGSCNNKNTGPEIYDYWNLPSLLSNTEFLNWEDFKEFKDWCWNQRQWDWLLLKGALVWGVPFNFLIYSLIYNFM